MTVDIDIAVELIRRCLMLTLLISAPILIAGLVVGVIVSLVQAVTQIQEQTLSFIPKIAAMFVAAIITLPWVGRHLMDYATELFTVGLMP